MRRMTRVIGILIAVAGLVFVVRELVRNWDEIASTTSGADPAILVAGVVTGLASMALIGLGWRRCLSLLGVRPSMMRVFYGYFVGQLGKYVPGGIWPIVGRAEMARRDGVSASIAYGSTALSMGITYLAAILTVAGAFLTGGASDGGLEWWPVLLLLPIGFLALHPVVVRWALALLSRFRKRELEVLVPSWATSVSLLIQHVPSWFGISTATWLVASTLSPGAVSFRNIVLATCLSWVVGFLAVGVPGGIGVREAVFVATATTLPMGTAAAVSLIARILFIVVDLLGAGLVTVAVASRRRSESGVSSAED